MAIKFQYNKTSLQHIEKQLKMRQRTLPIIKNKETALRLEVKKCKKEADDLDKKLESQIAGYESMYALWGEFDTSLVALKDVELDVKKVAGVRVPVLNNIQLDVKPFGLFSAPKWYFDGINLLQGLAKTAVEREFVMAKLGLLDHARRKTTQKVNLFEKVQIPGFQEAIRKIKRFMEDEENLSKSSQKILKSLQEKRAAEGRRRRKGGQRMITKMKKLTFLVTNKEYEQFLADIRKIGVVHIEELQSGATSAEFEAGKALAERYKNALKALDYAQETYTTEQHYNNVDLAGVSDVKTAGLKLVEEVEGLLAEENALRKKDDDEDDEEGKEDSV